MSFEPPFYDDDPEAEVPPEAPEPSETPEPVEEDTTPAPPRHGRARDRVRRRRERQTGTTPPLGRGLSHLNRQTTFNWRMPNVQIPQVRWIAYVIGGAALIIAVVLLLGRLKNDQPQAHPNAVWIGTEWTYELHEPEVVDELVERLRDHQIGTIYAWVSWLQGDETWRGAENFAAVRQFAEQFKEAYPEAQLFGWLSFPVNMGENNYRLDNEELQQNIADFSARVVSDLGFDGIFLNIEPVWNGDENMLGLLRRVRLSIGESVPIAVAIPPDWSPLDAAIPLPPLIAPGTVWDKEYKQNVALLADQMAIMAYNSGLNSESNFTPEDYSQWTAYQVTAFIEAVSELGAGTQLFIGIPTYEAEPPGHDPAVENVASAIEGVKLGLAQAGEAAAYVEGLAIYAGWTTDDLEWLQFKSLWVNR